MIAHIVLFQSKQDLSSADRRAFAQSFQAACRQIGSVRRAVLGKSLSIDAGYERIFGDKTYEYAAIMEFDDRHGLIEYLKHPLHDDLGRMFWLACESTVITEVELVDAKSPGVDVEAFLGLKTNS